MYVEELDSLPSAKENVDEGLKLTQQTPLHSGVVGTCAIESAAKENPDRPIQGFIPTDHVSLSAPLRQVLEHYSNVDVLLLDAAEYFSGTILQS